MYLELGLLKKQQFYIFGAYVDLYLYKIKFIDPENLVFFTRV